MSSAEHFLQAMSGIQKARQALKSLDAILLDVEIRISAGYAASVRPAANQAERWTNTDTRRREDFPAPDSSPPPEGDDFRPYRETINLSELLDAIEKNLAAEAVPSATSIDDDQTLLPSQSKVARRLLAWSQATLAAAAGVSLASILNLENRRRPVSQTIQLKVRAALEGHGLSLADGGVAVPGSALPPDRQSSTAASTHSSRAQAPPLILKIRQLLESKTAPLAVDQITFDLIAEGALAEGDDSQTRVSNALKWWARRHNIEKTVAGTYRFVRPQG